MLHRIVGSSPVHYRLYSNLATPRSGWGTLATDRKSVSERSNDRWDVSTRKGVAHYHAPSRFDNSQKMFKNQLTVQMATPIP
jgi:hypothetical protein